MKYKYLILILTCVSICTWSCKKFLEIAPPKSKLVTETVFTSDSTAVAAIRGLYSNMVSGGTIGGGASGLTFYTSLSADELYNYSISTTNTGFYQNSISASNSVLPGLWNNPYKSIFEANAIIEGLTKSVAVSEPIKKQLLGEAKFIRAFSHFYLTNLFGDIPLILSTDYRLNTVEVRTPKVKIYNQIVLDLKDAQSTLSEDYSLFSNSRIRPNKFAATALLARVYLYANDWINAEIEATSVIDNKTLYDTVSLGNVFIKNSKESIWQLLPRAGANTDEGSNFILTAAPSTGVANSATISSNLLNAFEPGDARKTKWIGSYTSTSLPITTYFFPYKYKVKQSSVQTEYYMILRVAEQYLIRAEARIHLGKIADGITDLNLLRKRAGATTPSPLAPLSILLSTNQALLAVEHERRVELFTEWGHRWLDLKRTSRADAIMSGVTTDKGGTWNVNWQLYPIPEIQLLNDPAMRNAQNPGYD